MLVSILCTIAFYYRQKRSGKFRSQLDRKSKTCFFTFLNVYVSWIEWDKILISQLTPLNFRYFADQNEWQKNPMKINFDNFQIQKWISQTVRAQKADEENRVICVISFFSSWVMVLKLPKIVHFFQIFADLIKKPKSIEAIYFYLSERPHHTLSWNSIFYKSPSNISRDNRDRTLSIYEEEAGGIL